MTTYVIPLVPTPHKFTVQLGGTTYGMRLYWCQPAECWVLDLSDAQGVPVVLGMPLVLGVDLLGQYKHLGLPGSLVVTTTLGPHDRATASDVGTRTTLYFVTG